MKIAFLGDSITEGCGASNSDKFYVSYVGRELGAEVLNYGISGTRIAKQEEPSEIASWDKDFLSRAEDIEKDADIVIVFGGTNDYGHGKAPIGSIDDATPYSFFGALKQLIEYLIKSYGAANIGFILPLRRFEDEKTNASNNASLSVYVSIINYVCSCYGIKVLDLFTKGIKKPETENGDEFTVDGVHPNDKGHLFIGEKIVEFIKSKFINVEDALKE